MAKLKLGVDVGGTFTDVVGINEDGKVYFAKTPSTPEDQSIGVLNGIRALLEELGVAPDCVTGVAHGTTVATNTLLERNGAVTALITTKGFRDVLDIGRQSRPELYDLHARKPASLIPRYLRREADERMDYTGTVLVQLDMEELKKTIHELMEEGAESIAICFLHSYANDENEKKALEVIREIAPDFPVSVSSEILPEFREFERMNTNAIIFASVSSASVGALFMATIVPGLIWAGLYLIINRIIYIKYYHPEYAGKTVASVSACTEDNEPKEESEKNARETISRNRFFLELVVAVLMPVIVLGGIYGGIFTATEAGAITCLYGAIMGVVVYKKLSLVQLMGVFSKGVKDVSALVIMFPMTLIFSRLMTLNHIPELVAELMLGITNNRIGLILLIDLLLFFIGFFLDGNVIILTLVPLLTPIATACGIDTIQLAVIVFVSIGIGSITPPMATCLMACSRVCDVPIHKLIKPILPFLLFGALPILLLVSFVPVVSTWLPGLFYSF